jgi:hypothetical protein
MRGWFLIDPGYFLAGALAGAALAGAFGAAAAAGFHIGLSGITNFFTFSAVVM